jgi:RecB family exonuclease
MFKEFNPNEKNFTDEASYLNKELENSYDSSVYNWKPGMVDKDGKMLKLRITKSTLTTYKFCPRMYYYQYVLGLKQEPTEAMTRGTNVHNVVEYFWKQIDEDVLKQLTQLLDEDKHMTAKGILREFMPKPEGGFLYDEDICLEQWFTWQWLRLLICYKDNTLEHWKAVGNEVEVHAMDEIEVEGQKVPLHYKGFIDRIFSDANGGFILMELKTGKWVNKPYKMSSMRFEMEFYKEILMKSQHMEFLPVTHWGWEYPYGQINGGDKADWIVEETKRLSTYASRSIANVRKKLVASHVNDDFPTVHSDKCKSTCRHLSNPCGWCSYYDICPAWNKIKEMTI